MQISSESVKVGHPDVVADIIAANFIAAILDEEKKQKMTLANMPHCGIEVSGKGHLRDRRRSALAGLCRYR
jgi:S-adenosylmethionine synthetase